MATYLALAVYGLIVMAIAFASRRSGSVDSFLMADRQVGTVGVGAATFSLIGGGELVALTSLAFQFGPSAISLFVGYASGFFVLGLIAKAVRADGESEKFISLPDYMYSKCGRVAGALTFLCSFAAFFSLLMLQFSAGGVLLGTIGGVQASSATIAIGALVTLYLALGGFRTVISSDVLQGVARLLLIPLLLLALSPSSVPPKAIGSAVDGMPLEVSVGLILTGFFTAMASADVWQRVYAARSESAARWGLWLGAGLMIVFGMLLVQLGVSAQQISPTSPPDDALVNSVRLGLPEWAAVLATILVLISVLSTADTEIFLLSSLLQRERRRISGALTSVSDFHGGGVSAARWTVVAVGVASTAAALLFSDLLTIYLWLITALLVLSPVVVGSFLVKLDPRGAAAALVLGFLLLVILGIAGKITLENAYWIVVPGFVVLASFDVARRVAR